MTPEFKSFLDKNYHSSDIETARSMAEFEFCHMRDKLELACSILEMEGIGTGTEAMDRLRAMHLAMCMYQDTKTMNGEAK